MPSVDVPQSPLYKMESSDFWNDPFYRHNDVLLSAAPGLVDRILNTFPAVGSSPDALIIGGAALLEMRLFAGGAAASADVGEVVRFRVYAFPCPKSPSDRAKIGPLKMLADYSVVCSGNVVADVHPFQQAATQAELGFDPSVLRWYEMNEVSAINYLLNAAVFAQSPDPVLGASYLGITPVDEIQTVVIVGTGSDWTLSFRGETTAAMTETETAASMKTKLEALSTIGAGNIATLTEAVDLTYIITFGLDLGGANLPMLVADKGSLTSATPSETTPGVSGRMMDFLIDARGYYGILVDVCSGDGTGNATRAAVGLKRVM